MDNFTFNHHAEMSSIYKCEVMILLTLEGTEHLRVQTQ
jgi:hypothetical protein